ncbi:unnamed protein product [Adineta ricciae]|uniref:Uncharacterized protein n=1 Tax=Adineta ricciae TaxID=249248 RepID=A0A814ETX4_ADIRI|nr:unnamed protein product [Adineta ricciae]
MSVGNIEEILPFADCEIEGNVDLKLPSTKRPKFARRPKQKSNSNVTNKPGDNFYVYFENAENDSDLLVFAPYTGPSNTSHLSISLSIPQLLSATSANDSTRSLQHFLYDYDKKLTSLKTNLETMTLSIYIRFGIFYITHSNLSNGQSIPVKVFTFLRNRGVKFKSSFYTCKGVTTPKTLVNTILKENYRQVCSNIYSYDIQLYGRKAYPHSTLHFQYDEQCQCRSVYYQLDYPTNFNFIRDKTSSRFRSTDNSYADIFDFRIQLVQGKYLANTDPNVLEILRGVPINNVLSFDPSTHAIQISPQLQKHVKYFKCTRSTKYQNSDDSILISMSTYEEFQMTKNGFWEPLMTASNTMNIEFLNANYIPSGKKLYDTGMWFSTLCQACVELPSATIKNAHRKKARRWFSDVLFFKQDQSITKINVDQLTRYTTNKTQKSFTSEELAFVKRILLEENTRAIFFDANESQTYTMKELQQRFVDLQKKLQANAAPSAGRALTKVHDAYQAIMKQLKLNSST